MDGLNHDASGNVLQYGLTAFTYDGASRVRTAGGVCYVYNAEGIRTAKGTWNGTSCANIASQYLLGRGGEQVTELVGLAGYVAWQHTNVGAGNLMATYDAQGLHFNFTDWQGTKRAQVKVRRIVDEQIAKKWAHASDIARCQSFYANALRVDANSSARYLYRRSRENLRPLSLTLASFSCV